MNLHDTITIDTLHYFALAFGLNFRLMTTNLDIIGMKTGENFFPDTY